MIFTGRYQDKRLTDATHLCVRTTLGPPRFRLAYTLAAQLPEMKPPREAMGLEEALFRQAYEAKLSTVGAGTFIERLQALQVPAAGRPVVLLCFCSLEAGGYCHRRVFAGWLAAQGGPVISELPT